jgi:DNA-binding NtrC family response regulator
MHATQTARVPMEPLQHWHTVLIVDDDPEVLSAMRRELGREPYDVVTTDRPGLALDWMERRTVSLVISDQRMPEMDGDRFLERVWKRSPRTRRLLLTGFPEQIELIPMSRRGLLRVMTKPWDGVELKVTIRRLLQEREEAPE